MYDPKDPFSLLNPYSAPNMLMKSSAAVYERHRQSVADSAKFVEKMQSARRSAPADAYYPRYTADSAPVVTGWTVTETETRTKRGRGFWVLVFIGLAHAAAVIFLS